jgi:hypothetical protein
MTLGNVALFGRLFLGCFLASSCVVARMGPETTWQPAATEVPSGNWRMHKVLFRAFDHKEIIGRSWSGSFSSTSFVETERISGWMLQAARDALPFGVVEVDPGAAATFTYILEGELTGQPDLSALSWAQLLFLWLPGAVLPTHLTHFEDQFTLRLFDADHRLLHTFSAQRKIQQLEWVWAMLNHEEYDDAHKKSFFREAMQQIGTELKTRIES